MKRQTYWNEEFGCWSYHCQSGDAAKLLASYEDTGLSPAQIEALKMNFEQLKNDTINANMNMELLQKEVDEISELKSKLELATPKKPTWIYDDEPICPNCSEVLDDGEEHCKVCDQRLCWTE